MGAESDLYASVSMLNITVGHLEVAVAELRTTVSDMKNRDVEERSAAMRREDRSDAAALKREDRIAALERWKSRIQGQIWVLGGVCAVLGGTLVARILHWI